MNTIIKRKLVLLAVILATLGCTKKDFGFFGGYYVASNSEYRQHSLNTKYQNEYKKDTLRLREGEKVNGKYPPFLVRDGKLYVLLEYGESGERKFYYPSSREREEMKLIFADFVDHNDPCLGMKWLRSNVRMQISHEEYPVEYKKMVADDQDYINFVRRSAGGFCDEQGVKTAKK